MVDLLLAPLVGGLVAVPAAVAASVLVARACTGLMHRLPPSGWLPYALLPVGLLAYVASYVGAGLGVPLAVAGAVWPGSTPALAAGAGAAVALVWRVIRKGGVG